ncbi:MAG: hypothetical protein Q9169_001939 [Polycauliona sp. 2 TL-2023]
MLSYPPPILIVHHWPHFNSQSGAKFKNDQTNLLLIHHLDIPFPSSSHNPYAPSPLTLLRYTATTILTLASLPQRHAKHAARNLAKPEPLFGLEEGKEGVIIGLGANAFNSVSGSGSGKGGKGREGKGMVMEMEYRRKSGRGVEEVFWVPSLTPSASSASPPSSPITDIVKTITLLDDHPLFTPSTMDSGKGSGFGDGEGEIRGEDLGGTFNLGLTEKQRRDREGVVLPYYDAQRRFGDDGGKGEGVGEGGRILYDMGVEDDFDEEEDEI